MAEDSAQLSAVPSSYLTLHLSRNTKALSLLEQPMCRGKLLDEGLVTGGAERQA